MKTKIYFLTLAASVAFAACTNDELESMNNADLQKTELVALDGIQATVSMKSGVDSRIANGQWEATDEVGVGFTNWLTDATGSFEGNGYDNGTLKNTPVDGTLYANHRLFRTEGTWKFENVVYEGLHYAYYPLDAKHTAVKPLTAKVGTEQVYGEEADFEANGIFAISSMYDLQEDQAGKAPVVNFALNTISNRLKLNLEVADFAGITDPIIVKTVKVKEISGTPVTAFAQSATVKDVPMVVYSSRNDLTDASTAAQIAAAETADATATAEAFKDAFVTGNTALTYIKAAEMGTTVKGHTGFTSAANTYAVNIFSFPVKDVPVTLAIEVETNYGVITVDNVAIAPAGETAAQKVVREANNKALESILKVLNGTHDTVKFTDREKAASATIKLDLKANKPVLSSISVANADEWAAAIKIASQVEAVNTINVTGDMAADLTNLPANVTTINVTAGKTLTISGNYTNQELTIATGKVKVAASTALTVNGTIAKPAGITISSEVENWGDITVGENGSMTLSGTTNNHANVVNKKSLTVGIFTNCKDEFDQNNPTTTHDCEGIVKNYATLTKTGDFTNKGTYYTIGAAAKLEGAGNFANVSVTPGEWTGTAITEEGGSFTGITGGVMKATVNTPAQMNAAVAAQATEITVTGVVSLDNVLAVTTTIILKDNAELYILAANKVGVNAINANPYVANYLSIAVEGENTKISATAIQDIHYLSIKPAASVEILEDTKLNIHDLSYDLDSEVTNNGLVYLVTLGKNSGLWKGMAINKKVVDSVETVLGYQ